MEIDPSAVQVGDLLSFSGQTGEVMSVSRIGDRWQVKLSVEGRGTVSLLSPPTNFSRVDTPLSRLASGQLDSPVEWYLKAEATRLSLAYHHDRLVSLSNSRTILEPYQVAAVHKVMSAWEQRFLIADDVGLGKTVEAGMVVKELKARGRGDKVLIIAPAGLTYQWQREMRNKFDEVFEVLSSRTLKQWHLSRPHGEELSVRYPHAIVSLDTAKPRDGSDFAQDFTNAHWDVVIIDEAHKVAQSARGTELTARYKLARDLAPSCDALLLLSATPHNGNAYTFHTLVELLDPLRFPDPTAITADEIEPIMVRRSKADILKDDGSPLFPPRWVETTEVKFSAQEMDLYSEVTDYVRDGYRAASEQRDSAVGFLMVLLQKRMVSSIAAIRRSLERRLIALKHPEAAAMKSGELREIKQRMDDEEALTDEQRQSLEEKLEASRLQLDSEAHKLEIARIERLVGLSRQIPVDSKAKELRTFIERLRQESPGEKLLVFTEYTDTLDYLRDEILADLGPIAQIHGGMDMEERQQQEEYFKQPEVALMLATDAAGEGLNLQFCHLMINYELPWNPNRIEQRIGRLHRYGQQHDVHVYNIQVTNTREGYILAKLIDKVKSIEKQLGGYAPNVLGLESSEEAVNLSKLSDLIMDAISADTPPEITAKQVEQALDARREMSQRIQTDLFQSLQRFDKSRIDKLIERSQRSTPTSNDIEQFVRHYFSQHDGKIENTRQAGIYRLKTPGRIRDGRHIASEFQRTAFDKEVAYDAQGRDAQFIAFGHPLLDAIIADCHATEPKCTGLVTCFEGVDRSTLGSGMLLNYVLRFSDARDETIMEELLPVFVSTDGAVKAMPFPVHLELIEKVSGGSSCPNKAEVVVMLQVSEPLAAAEAASYSDELHKSVLADYDRMAETSIRNLKEFEQGKQRRLEGSISSFKQRQAEGDDMSIAIRRAEHELELLAEDCARRREQIEKRRHVQAHAPRLLNIAILNYT